MRKPQETTNQNLIFPSFVSIEPIGLDAATSTLLITNSVAKGKLIVDEIQSIFQAESAVEQESFEDCNTVVSCHKTRCMLLLCAVDDKFLHVATSMPWNEQISGGLGSLEWNISGLWGQEDGVAD